MTRVTFRARIFVSFSVRSFRRKSLKTLYGRRTLPATTKSPTPSFWHCGSTNKRVTARNSTRALNRRRKTVPPPPLLRDRPRGQWKGNEPFDRTARPRAACSGDPPFSRERSCPKGNPFGWHKSTKSLRRNSSFRNPMATYPTWLCTTATTDWRVNTPRTGKRRHHHRRHLHQPPRQKHGDNHHHHHHDKTRTHLRAIQFCICLTFGNFKIDRNVCTRSSN